MSDKEFEMAERGEDIAEMDEMEEEEMDEVEYLQARFQKEQERRNERERRQRDRDEARMSIIEEELALMELELEEVTRSHEVAKCEYEEAESAAAGCDAVELEAIRHYQAVLATKPSDEDEIAYADQKAQLASKRNRKARRRVTRAKKAVLAEEVKQLKLELRIDEKLGEKDDMRATIMKAQIERLKEQRTWNKEWKMKIRRAQAFKELEEKKEELSDAQYDREMKILELEEEISQQQMVIALQNEIEAKKLQNDEELRKQAKLEQERLELKQQALELSGDLEKAKVMKRVLQLDIDGLKELQTVEDRKVGPSFPKSRADFDTFPGELIKPRRLELGQVGEEAQAGSRQAVQIKVRRQPFSYGSLRFVHHMEMNGRPYVAKYFIKGGMRIFLEPNLRAANLSCIGSCFAERFNAMARGVKVKKLEFLDAHVVKCAATSEDGDDKYYMVEEMVKDGEWVKMNNNSEFSDADYRTAQAFSHYTYHVTEGKMLMVDIQGWKRKGKYVLTDPAIHSHPKLGVFGSTDTGEEGMQKFFSGHKCNKICRALALPQDRSAGYEDVESDDEG